MCTSHACDLVLFIGGRRDNVLFITYLKMPLFISGLSLIKTGELAQNLLDVFVLIQH